MADEQQGPERRINIHFEPKDMAGAYANFANVSHSDYEFTLTFARVDHEVEDEEIPSVVGCEPNRSRAQRGGSGSATFLIVIPRSNAMNGSGASVSRSANSSVRASMRRDSWLKTVATGAPTSIAAS